MAMSSQGVGGAHRLFWYNQLGQQVFALGSTATDSIPWRLDRTNNGLFAVADNKTVFSVGRSASAVNYIGTFANSAGNAPLLLAEGDDANIDIRFSPKGSGLVRFGAFTTNDDAPINGYITIKAADGSTRKLATIA
jgi:hypothetical protein